jgi:valyl-tRNA synthetase
MPLPKKYIPSLEEPKLQSLWAVSGVYNFQPAADRPVYSIDTPPPTVSGNLHLGHTYSYTHTDIFARFHRMLGENVFYPMGFDDNGLPTERLVEKELGARASEIDLRLFAEKCQEISERVEKGYQDLWQRLGLSIDWHYSYRTIDHCSRLTSQRSFIDLYKAGLVYQQEAPTIWCPECGTAIAQADVDDLERTSELVILAFTRDNDEILPIATTRPELLPACVSIIVHPGDERYSGLIGQEVKVPLFNFTVPIIADPAANPEIGTGAVMCCTFGDTSDKHWWYTHHLKYINAIDREGKLTEAAGEFAGLLVAEARELIKQKLGHEGLLLKRQPTIQVVPIHERCDTPVEILMSQQWFIRLMDFKPELLAAADRIDWHPQHMKKRYQSWVENLAWDWCISRQRYYGIHFPIWYCAVCGDVILADEAQLPIDPRFEQPSQPCTCGSRDFIPEGDILETWATSSMTPQIAGRWLCEDLGSDHQLFDQVYPYSLRPQAHEIIRTWAFYTIAKSHLHHKLVPWEEIAISGWGIAGEGMGKISKSRGGDNMPPLEMIERYSADSVRYWAASSGLGKDAVISEDKIRLGGKLATKLWNVARFSEGFISGFRPASEGSGDPDFISKVHLSPADRWILSRLQQIVQRSTQLLNEYEYAPAKSEIEHFFWNEFADNYLEMCKLRLYAGEPDDSQGARYTLYSVLLTTCKLFAPFMPFITESIYQGLFAQDNGSTSGNFDSIHLSAWPKVNEDLLDDFSEQVGEILIEIAAGVRRFKSENSLPLGMELQQLQIAIQDTQLSDTLQQSKKDILSITRAREIRIGSQLDPDLKLVTGNKKIRLGIQLG